MLVHMECEGQILADLTNMFSIYGTCNVNIRQICVAELKIEPTQVLKANRLICSKCEKIIISIGELGTECQTCGRISCLVDLFVQEGMNSPFYCSVHMARYKKTNDVNFRPAFRLFT